MPTLKQNRKASCSRSHTHSETHNFLTQVQQQPMQPMQQPMQPKDHNLKRKATEPEDVAEEEEDSENEVVESPEIKRAKTEYLKSLYAGNKQQSEVVVVETDLCRGEVGKCDTLFDLRPRIRLGPV